MTWMWYAIVASVALTPLYLVRFAVGSIPLTIFELVILFLCAATIIRAALFKQARDEYRAQLKKIPRSLIIAAALFFIAATISIFAAAPELRAALGIWKAYFLEAIAYGLVVWLHLQNKKQLVHLAWAFSVTAFVVAGWAVIQKWTGWGIPNPFWRAEETRRVTSVFGYPNAVGLYLELCVPWFVAMFFATKSFVQRSWFLFVTILSAAAIIFAESSGTVAALGAAAGIFLILYKRTRWWVIGATVLGIVILLLSPYKKAFADEFLLQGFSGDLRTQMWKETVVMLRERPIVGAGLAAYQERVKPFHVYKWAEIYLYPHNLVLTLWSETGLLGIASFVWIFCLLVWWSARAYAAQHMKLWSGVVLATCIIIAVHGLVDTPYFKNDLSALFWLLVAVGLFVRYTPTSQHSE